MSVFDSISESRLELIEKIAIKLGQLQNQSLEASFGAQLAESLTLTEALLISLGLEGEAIEASLDAAMSKLEPLLKVYEAIGIPLHVPQNRLSSAQREAIEKSQADLQAVNRLLKLWQKANQSGEGDR
jgi:hypothetical protein